MKIRIYKIYPFFSFILPFFLRSFNIYVNIFIWSIFSFVLYFIIFIYEVISVRVYMFKYYPELYELYNRVNLDNFLDLKSSKLKYKELEYLLDNKKYYLIKRKMTYLKILMKYGIFFMYGTFIVDFIYIFIFY